MSTLSHRDPPRNRVDAFSVACISIAAALLALAAVMFGPLLYHI